MERWIRGHMLRSLGEGDSPHRVYKPLGEQKVVQTVTRIMCVHLLVVLGPEELIHIHKVVVVRNKIEAQPQSRPKHPSFLVTHARTPNGSYNIELIVARRIGSMLHILHCGMALLATKVNCL